MKLKSIFSPHWKASFLGSKQQEPGGSAASAWTQRVVARKGLEGASLTAPVPHSSQLCHAVHLLGQAALHGHLLAPINDCPQDAGVVSLWTFRKATWQALIKSGKGMPSAAEPLSHYLRSPYKIASSSPTFKITDKVPPQTWYTLGPQDGVMGNNRTWVGCLGHFQNVLLFHFWRIQIISEGSWELSDSSLRISASLLEVSSSRPTPQACIKQCPSPWPHLPLKASVPIVIVFILLQSVEEDVHILPSLIWNGGTVLEVAIGLLFSVPHREGR